MKFKCNKCNQSYNFDETKYDVASISISCPNCKTKNTVIIDEKLYKMKTIIKLGESLYSSLDIETLKSSTTSMINNYRNEWNRKIPFPIIRKDDNLNSCDFIIQTKHYSTNPFTVKLNKIIALSNEETTIDLSGDEFTEPSFSLKAFWIDEAEREFAENNKFTIINSISLINTQLSEIINLQADRIYGQDKYKDKITLHLGVNLLDLVRSSELQNSISVSRKLFAERNGWSFSAIRILDNLLLQPYEYSISIQGKLIGSNYLEPNKLLAMVPYSSSEKYEVINSIVGYGIWMDNEVEFENLPEDSIPFSHADLIAYHLEKIILDNSEIFQKGN